MQIEEADPKGLIRESFRIDGITPAECRSIFVDWALSLPDGVSVPDAVRTALAHYAPGATHHPMQAVLAEALAAPAAPRRRGGRAARVPVP